MWLGSSWLLIVNGEKRKTYLKVELLNKKEAQLKDLENYQLTHIAKNGNTKDAAKWSFDKDISMELTISTEARGWKNVAEGDQRSSGLPLPTQVQSAWTLGIWLLLSRFQRTGMLGRVVSLGSQSREPQDPSGEPRHGRSHHREPLRGHLTEPLGGHCHSSGPGKQSLEPRGLFSRFKI